MGNGVAVGNTCIVQCPIVATDAPVTAPLRHLIWRRGPVAGSRADDAKFQHVVKLLPGSVQAFRGQPAVPCIDRRRWMTSCFHPSWSSTTV